MIVTVGVPAILKGDDGKIKYIEMATEVKLRDVHDILDNVNHKLYRKLEEIKKEIQQHKQRQNVDKLIDEAHIQLTVEAFEENDYKNNVALTITVNDMINMKHPLLHPNWYEAAKVPNPEGNVHILRLSLV